MPAEKIATTLIHNGDEQCANVLRVAWGAKGGCLEAPNGWVNAGYAHINITKESIKNGTALGIDLDADEIDHLIRTLKRVRRQAFRTPQPRD